MVNKAKMKKIMKQFTPKRANIAGIGGEALELPNLNKGKAPESERDLANKKYVDDSFPVTHASTTGQTGDDHHVEFTTTEHSAIGDSAPHHVKAVSGDIDHDATVNTHNLTTDIVHDNITSGTIADHDTSATGTELNTLTDNSMADALHRHSELSASDGTPDQTVALSADGTILDFSAASGNGTTPVTLKIHTLSNTTWTIGSEFGRLDFVSNDESGDFDGGETRARIAAVLENTTGTYTGMSFYTMSNDTVLKEQVRITRAGNVGIGTTSPTAKLDVEGSSRTVILKILHTNLTQGVGIGYDSVKKIGSTTNSFLRLDAAGTGDLLLQTTATGNVGIGTATPTTKLSVNEKSGMTAIGGFCIKLTNETGGNTVAGQVVIADPDVDDAFNTAGNDSENAIGIVLEAGVSDGSEAWIVVSGIADVYIGEDADRGDRIIAGAAGGEGDVWNVGGAIATHFREIGHCIENTGGAGLARCVLHFN